MSGAVLGANIRAVNKHKFLSSRNLHFSRRDRSSRTQTSKTEGWWHVREKDKAGKTGSAGRPLAFMLSLLTLMGGGADPSLSQGIDAAYRPCPLTSRLMNPTPYSTTLPGISKLTCLTLGS